MYYIIFVVIGLIVSSLIFLFSQNIVKKVYHKDISKKAEDRIFFVTALFCFGAPIIYEFKPLFFSPQYEISRGVDGNILDLKPDATGFHLPFCSSEKFVCLPKSVKDMKGKVIYWLVGLERKSVEINYVLSCEDYPKVFISSNGFYPRKNIYSFFGGNQTFFFDWAQDGLYKILDKNFLTTEKENKKNKIQTPTDVYDFVSKGAEEWNVSNPYSCRIDVVQP